MDFSRLASRTFLGSYNEMPNQRAIYENVPSTVPTEWFYRSYFFPIAQPDSSLDAFSVNYYHFFIMKFFIGRVKSSNIAFLLQIATFQELVNFHKFNVSVMYLYN